jgi:hypothetical protein
MFHKKCMQLHPSSCLSYCSYTYASSLYTFPCHLGHFRVWTFRGCLILSNTLCLQLSSLFSLEKVALPCVFVNTCRVHSLWQKAKSRSFIQPATSSGGGGHCRYVRGAAGLATHLGVPPPTSSRSGRSRCTLRSWPVRPTMARIRLAYTTSPPSYSREPAEPHASHRRPASPPQEKPEGASSLFLRSVTEVLCHHRRTGFSWQHPRQRREEREGRRGV